MDDFLGLGLIGVVYGLCVWVQAWGFLGVFFAAVALRQTEFRLSRAERDLQLDVPPTEVSIGSLVFKEHLERLSELILVLLVGGSRFVNSWSWAAVALALFLFLVARPLSEFVALYGLGTAPRMLGLTG